jgi:hypothetical protein
MAVGSGLSGLYQEKLAVQYQCTASVLSAKVVPKSTITDRRVDEETADTAFLAFFQPRTQDVANQDRSKRADDDQPRPAHPQAFRFRKIEQYRVDHGHRDHGDHVGAVGPPLREDAQQEDPEQRSERHPADLKGQPQNVLEMAEPPCDESQNQGKYRHCNPRNDKVMPVTGRFFL